MKKILAGLALLALAATVPAQTIFDLYTYGRAKGRPTSGGTLYAAQVGDVIYVTDTLGRMRPLRVGTNGQCLLVASGLPAWGACGGGGGGSSPLTTKGDLWGYSTLDARFPVGTNGHALFADSTQTFGLIYRAIAQADVTNLVSDLAGKQAAFGTQTANTLYAGPISGGAATPTFRPMAPGDLLYMTAAGFGHQGGAVPDPGAAAHATPYYLGDDADWHKIDELTTKGDLSGYSTLRDRIPVGTNGQVLTADSAQALGLKWAAAAGGFTSPLTTKGDVHTFSTVDARLGVGSNGQVLTADSAQTTGLLWSTVSGTLSGGSTNAIPYWTSGTALGNSSLVQDATTLAVTQTGISTSTPRGLVVQQTNTGAQSARLFLRKANGTVGAETAAGSTNNIGAVAFQAHQGSGTYVDVAQISVANTAVASGGFGTGILQFFTANGAAVAEHLRIAANGDVTLTNGAGITGLKADTTGDGSVFTLPPADGTAGACLQTDGAKKWVYGNCLGVGSSASTTLTGTFAARPSAASAGVATIYYPTDSYAIFRSTGSVWEGFASGVKLTDPTLLSYSWVNQGASTVDSTNGGIFMAIPGSTTSNLRVYEFATPANTFTVTAAIIYPIPNASTSVTCGIGLKEAGNAKMYAFAIGTDAGSSGIRAWFAYKYTNVTTFSATYTSGPTPSYNWGLLNWIRIQDDGTNRISSTSIDGIHWTQRHSVGRTDFLTPASLGMFYVQTTVNPAVAHSCWLVSLAVT